MAGLSSDEEPLAVALAAALARTLAATLSFWPMRAPSPHMLLCGRSGPRRQSGAEGPRRATKGERRRATKSERASLAGASAGLDSRRKIGVSLERAMAEGVRLETQLGDGWVTIAIAIQDA